MGKQGWRARDRGTLWVFDRERLPLSPVPPRCVATFQELDEPLSEQLADVMGVARSGVVRARLQSGRRCFVALAGEALVAYAWVSRDCEEVGELERVLVLSPGECYVWDCATVPAHRGNRLYTALLSHVLSRLADEGAQRVWIGATRANRPSIRGIALAGFRPVADTHYMRFWHMRMLLVTAHPQAAPTLVAGATRMMTQPHERRIGRLVIGLGAPSIQPCGAG
jgi:GNAT superfamily N-acetyltransferase